MHPWVSTLVSAAVLAAFVTVIAYIHAPRIKTLVFSMPVPFTCAYFASRSHIDTTNFVGLVFVTLYHWIVYELVRRRKLPLGVGIASGVVVFIGACAALKPVAERVPFLVAALVVTAGWVIAVLTYRPAEEPGHRGAAPWWIKAPTVFVLSLGIFGLKGLLGGAVTVFPYAGVFTSYEMRHSLKTLAGQYTVNNIGIIAMLVAMWAVQRSGMPEPWPIAAGWVVVVTCYALVYYFELGKPDEAVPTGD